jgi:hypothetical protein
MLAMGLLFPVAAFAEPGDGPGSAETVVVPSSVEGTTMVDLSDPADPYYAHWYSVEMLAGQTIQVTVAGGTGPLAPIADMFAVGVVPPMISSRYVSDTVDQLFFMADHDGWYRLVVSTDTTAPFTLETQVVDPLAYSLSSVVAPKKAKKNKAFKVLAALSLNYDALVSPIRFLVQRKVGRSWKAYKSWAGKPLNDSDIDYTPFSATVKLPKGSFRVRAKFADAAHAATYSGYKTVTVK